MVVDGGRRYRSVVVSMGVVVLAVYERVLNDLA